MQILLPFLAISLTTASAQKRGTVLQAHATVGNLGFTVGPKLFPKSEIDSLIKADVHVDSLLVYPSTTSTIEGGTYELKNIYVLAIDSKRAPIAPAPLELELKSFNSTLGTERIIGFWRGTSRVRITSLLPSKDKKTKTGVKISVVVTPWPR